MKKKKEIIKSSSYWFEKNQNEFFRQFYNFIQDNNISQAEMAKKLNVTKGYISQILNGNFNPTLRKLIELSLAIKKVPEINYKTFDEVLHSNSYKEIIIGSFLKTFNNCYFQTDENNMIEIEEQKTVKTYKLKPKYETELENVISLTN